MFPTCFLSTCSTHWEHQALVFGLGCTCLLEGGATLSQVPSPSSCSAEHPLVAPFLSQAGSSQSEQVPMVVYPLPHLLT